MISTRQKRFITKSILLFLSPLIFYKNRVLKGNLADIGTYLQIHKDMLIIGLFLPDYYLDWIIYTIYLINKILNRFGVCLISSVLYDRNFILCCNSLILFLRSYLRPQVIGATTLPRKIYWRYWDLVCFRRIFKFFLLLCHKETFLKCSK